MDFNTYEEKAAQTAINGNHDPMLILAGLTLGITGEAGELAEKVKKLIFYENAELTPEKRDAIMHEMGDVLWYLSQLSRTLRIPFDDVAEANIKKLADRAARGVLKSEGDSR